MLRQGSACSFMSKRSCQDKEEVAVSIYDVHLPTKGNSCSTSTRGLWDQEACSCRRFLRCQGIEIQGEGQDESFVEARRGSNGRT